MGATGVLTKPVKTKATLDDLFGQLKNFITARDAQVVMIVEDDADQRAAIVAAVGAGDIEMLTPESREQAMEVLRHQPPELIITSLAAPEKKSFDFIEEIKEDAALSEVPLIVYTRTDLSARTRCD